MIHLLQNDAYTCRPIEAKIVTKGGHFADHTFKCIFMYGSRIILIKSSLKFSNNDKTLVEIMAWHQTCYKPLSEPMV